ncbi:PstS family phosphate ABC transporter substrate-binding protein [Halodesulfurarchaeum formicicum]|uniref:PstS family phosphate ABC transporter substrate-binding protein n=1 Tax=Halodesulfurarchaeum formicicum TaxID=1873524 RepID=UPI0009043B37|nr:PstS family phosphate ABC transporter substrate-binding protein [Halodesulfurarchaeum formicicum]
MARDDGRNTLTRRRLIAGAGAAGATILAGCTSTDNDGGTTSEGLSGAIEISGSSTVFPLAEAVAEQFMKDHPQVDISVKSTGTGGGFENHFSRGRSQFNNASRQITDAEEDMCADNGIEPLELRVATDALTVVVNNEAEWIDCITVEELRQVWSADGPDTWQEINSDWPDETIERYGPADTSGTFDYFREEILGEEYNHSSDYQPTEQDNLIVQGVQGSEFAVGYFGFSYYYNNPDSVKALAIDGGDGCVDPSVETAKSGEYTPLSRPLFTYAAKGALAEEHVAEFARFYVEQSGNQELVADRVGYVPNTEAAVDEQLAALETAIEDAG